MVDDLIQKRWEQIKEDAAAKYRLAIHFKEVYKKNPCCLETIKSFHRTLRRNWKRELSNA